MSNLSLPHDDSQKSASQLDNVQVAREQFEQQKLTRRAALRRIGVTTGVAVFGLLSVDDLARFSAQQLKDHKATRAIGESLAREFKGAGVALAQPPQGDCGVDCLNAHADCNAECGPEPWGCNASGGSVWPQCWAYDFCLFQCGVARRSCDLDCAANGL